MLHEKSLDDISVIYQANVCVLKVNQFEYSVLQWNLLTLCVWYQMFRYQI